MPLPPRNPYFKWTCDACGWFTVTKEKSDRIMRLVVRCPKCAGTRFTPSSGTALDAIAAEFKHIISR